MSTGGLSQTTYATRRKHLLAVIDQLRANGYILLCVLALTSH